MSVVPSAGYALAPVDTGEPPVVGLNGAQAAVNYVVDGPAAGRSRGASLAHCSCQAAALAASRATPQLREQFANYHKALNPNIKVTTLLVSASACPERFNVQLVRLLACSHLQHGPGADCLLLCAALTSFVIYAYICAGCECVNTRKLGAGRKPASNVASWPPNCPRAWAAAGRVLLSCLSKVCVARPQGKLQEGRCCGEWGAGGHGAGHGNARLILGADRVHAGATFLVPA
jgi:hypothetical protein